MNANDSQKDWIGGRYLNPGYVGYPISHADASRVSSASTILPDARGPNHAALFTVATSHGNPG
jgi:hypothetical protein